MFRSEAKAWKSQIATEQIYFRNITKFAILKLHMSTCGG